MRPKLRLSRLRDIGWTLWDPIGLLDEGDTWVGKPFADEYDGYLVHAAGQLRRGAPAQDVVDYLSRIESEHMGLGAATDMDVRIQAVVRAIRSDKDLWSPPMDQTR